MATPVRHIRVPDEQWDAWAEDADRSGLSISAWVRAVCTNHILERPCRRRMVIGQPEISEVSSDEHGDVIAEIGLEP